MQASRKYLDRFTHIEDPLRRTYAAMVSAVDDGVGRLLDTLDELGLTDNTLVFFLSDNGGASNNGSINTPLRANKGTIYEGGMRVPFAFRWPGKIPAGIDYDYPVSSMDILGTMVDLTGVEIAADRPLDGVSLMPFLTGKQEGPPHDMLFWKMFDKEHGAVRSGSDKLVVMEKEGFVELYQLSDDVGESDDLSSKEKDKVQSLKKEFEAWESQLKPAIFDPLGTWKP